MITFGLNAFANNFAEASPGGIAALGLDFKYFLFQLISFVILLLILRKWVFPKLVATLEERREAVIQSLDQAKEAEAALRKAEKQIAAMLHEARSQADEVIDGAHKEANKQLEAAEAKAFKRAEHIVAEAKSQMASDLRAARVALKQETVQLVAQATEQIIREKLDAGKNAKLIETALKQSETKHE